MTERPDTWMPMYWADYFADTGELSVIEHGAYLLLIGHYWRKGPLPDDDERLARIARCTPSEWRRVRPAVAGFFAVADGVWTHSRVEREWERAASITAKRAAAGRASAEQRKGQQKAQQTANTCSTHVDGVLQQNGRPSPSPSHPRTSYEGESASPSAPASPPSKAKRGSRLPDDWELPPDWRAYAVGLLTGRGISEGSAADWATQTAEAFRDHWWQSSQPTAIKRDWLAAWRVWVRKEISDGRIPSVTQAPVLVASGPPEKRLREATLDEQELARRVRKVCGRMTCDADVAEWRKLDEARAA